MVQAITAPFTSMVAGVGQHGCGYEASLEVDLPLPHRSQSLRHITVDKTAGGLGVSRAHRNRHRAAPAAQGLPAPRLAGVGHHGSPTRTTAPSSTAARTSTSIVPPSGSPAKSILTHGTSACHDNPNDACCFSCLQHNTPPIRPPPDAWPLAATPSARRASGSRPKIPRTSVASTRSAVRNRLPLSGPALHRRLHQDVVPRRSHRQAWSPTRSIDDLAVQRGAACAPDAPTRPRLLGGHRRRSVARHRRSIPTISRSGYKTGKQISRRQRLGEDPRRSRQPGRAGSAHRSAHDRVGHAARRVARARQRRQRRSHPRPRVGHVQGQPGQPRPAVRVHLPAPHGLREDVHRFDRLRLRQPDQRHGGRHEEPALPGPGTTSTATRRFAPRRTPASASCRCCRG